TRFSRDWSSDVCSYDLRQSHILQMSHRPLRSQWVTAVSHLGGAMAPSLPAAAQGPGRTRFTEGTGRNPAGWLLAQPAFEGLMERSEERRVGKGGSGRMP